MSTYLLFSHPYTPFNNLYATVVLFTRCRVTDVRTPQFVRLSQHLWQGLSHVFTRGRARVQALHPAYTATLVFFQTGSSVCVYGSILISSGDVTTTKRLLLTTVCSWVISCLKVAALSSWGKGESCIGAHLQRCLQHSHAPRRPLSRA